MTATGNLSQYLGRSVDLLAFQGQQPAGDQLLVQTLVDGASGGLLCTGVQKLMQRWLIEFMTLSGSLRYLPARGCDFIGQMLRGELRTMVDVQQAFFLSASQVAVNLTAEDDAAAPADEILGNVDLLNITIGGDSLSLSIVLLSSAGNAAVAILPIPVRTR